MSDHDHCYRGTTYASGAWYLSEVALPEVIAHKAGTLGAESNVMRPYETITCSILGSKILVEGELRRFKLDAGVLRTRNALKSEAGLW